MVNTEHLSSGLCMCSSIVLKDKELQETISELTKLFADKKTDEKNLSYEIGFIKFSKEYSIGTNKLRIRIDTVPSKGSMLKAFEKDFKDASLKEKEKIANLKKKVISTTDKLCKFSKIKCGKEKGILHFSLRCEPTNKKKPLNLKTLLKLNPSIKKFFRIIEKKSPKFVPTNGCVEFIYDRNKYRLIGGFTLPTKIPLSKEVVNRLGEASVTGIQLSFKNSLSNLNRINIESNLERFEIFTEFSAQINISSNLLNDICDYGIKASSLFVEIKND